MRTHQKSPSGCAPSAWTGWATHPTSSPRRSRRSSSVGRRSSARRCHRQIVREAARALDRGEIVELVGTIAMFGSMNRWNDPMATPLNAEPVEVGEGFLSCMAGTCASTRTRQVDSGPRGSAIDRYRAADPTSSPRVPEIRAHSPDAGYPVALPCIRERSLRRAEPDSGGNPRHRRSQARASHAQRRTTAAPARRAARR